MGDTLSDLLPVLVSDLVDDESLDFLWGVALANGTARIPLIAPPIDATDHALEVYAAGAKEPLILIATPEGLPDEHGFPLRLRPATGSVARTSRKKTTTTNPKAAGDLRPRRVTAATLTKRHSRDLMGDVKGDTSSPLALVGRAISGGKLVIEALLGAGGMGAVYKARHAGLNMHVAVKVLHESYQHDVEFCKRFHAEALAASQLVHPNLTRVHDFGQEPDGLLYIAMEFLEGQSLRSLLERDGRLGVERAVKLMMQVCAGLLHVHARALVHRDIKPDNLLVLPGMDDDGEPIEQVKVCDFGIAVGGSQANAKLAGTPDYMSPEQCRGDAVDARSDVYACGASLYELVTGVPPFDNDNMLELMRAHMEETPKLPSARVPGIPPALDDLLMKSLSKDPASRQESARELRRELKAVLDAPRREMPPSSRHIPAAAASQAQPVFRTAEDTRDYASTLARDPAAYVAKLTAATNEYKFAEAVAALDGAVPRLMERGEVAAILTIAGALDEIAKERTPRATVAESALKPFSDPQLLAPIADHALGGPDVVAAGSGRVISRAGTGGAYALFTARVKNRSPTARSRFRTLLPTLGIAALPVIRSALERIMSNPEAFGAMEVATDLLLSLPAADDEVLGNIVARYARAADETVAAAATWALPRLWGLRAQALLVALLHHPGESARIAAASALQQLDAVDEHVVRKLAAVALDPTPKSGAGVRVAAAHALVGAREDAKNAAAEVLVHAMDQWAECPELVDLTECLFALCGPAAASVVQKRASVCKTKVRAELERLVAEQQGSSHT